MPKYFYIAQSLDGQKESGILEAGNVHELARILRQKGYFLISANLEEKKTTSSFFKNIFRDLFGVSLKEKIVFTRNLQIMIASGLTLPRALKILMEQSKNKRFRQILKEINDEILKGKDLSTALSLYPSVISEFFQNIIKVGEESGTLDNSLKILTNQMEKENELRNRIKGAMIYPAVILTAMMAIGFLMLIVVVPRLAETFAELEIELPFTTRLVIFLGTLLTKRWYLIILAIIIFLILLRMSLKTEVGKKIKDTLFLKLPIISTIIKKTNSAYTARILSSLLAAGVPIIRSLEIVSRTLTNVYFKSAISEAAEKVKKGGKLADSLRPYSHLYSELVIGIIEVGEETGEMARVLEKIADFFEEEVANATKNLSAVIEPLLMLLIGAIVGFFAISMIQPIYSMLEVIK